MLTKSDLKLIKDAIASTSLTKEDGKSLATKDDLKGLVTKEDAKRFASKDDLKGLVTKEDAKRFSTKEDLKPLRNDLAKIRKDMSTIVGFFDQEYLDLRKRVEKIEEHLGITPSN